MTQYTVVAGDTHYEIAQRHGLTLEQLYNLNPGLQNHVYDMQIGTIVNVGGAPQGYNQPQPTPTYGGQPAPQPSYNQPQQPPQQQQQQQQQEQSIWNSTGMHVAEGVLGTAAVVGLGAFAVHQWRENKKHNAQSNAPAFTQYNSSRGPLFWRAIVPGTHVPQDAIQLGQRHRQLASVCWKSPLCWWLALGQDQRIHSLLVLRRQRRSPQTRLRSSLWITKRRSALSPRQVH
ncbi:hypothetical protein BDR26DRAFT_29245 [Obelidium mucronatum]|nr:hypothetical protein BDR26DRAFT_29245 [Obelidium mucronatum]